jgi:hypothetical protein
MELRPLSDFGRTFTSLRISVAGSLVVRVRQEGRQGNTSHPGQQTLNDT